MLGLALRLLLAGAALCTTTAVVAAVVIYVEGKITRPKLSQKMRENGVNKAIVEAIDRCNNTVKLKDFESDKVLEIHGDDMIENLREEEIVYV